MLNKCAFKQIRGLDGPYSVTGDGLPRAIGFQKDVLQLCAGIAGCESIVANKERQGFPSH